MDGSARTAADSVFVFSVDGDPTIREGDWLRLWNTLGLGVAHEVWVGIGGIVYENSGPGGTVRRNSLQRVLLGRKLIHILGRTLGPLEVAQKMNQAEARLGAPWSAFYTCQDFASEIAVGKPQSFQRDAVAGIVLTAGFLWLMGRD